MAESKVLAMLEQKASEPTRNSLWEDQNEAALSQCFLSSADPPPHSEQLSSSFPNYSPSRLPAALIMPLVPQSPRCDAKGIAPALTSLLFGSAS